MKKKYYAISPLGCSESWLVDSIDEVCEAIKSPEVLEALLNEGDSIVVMAVELSEEEIEELGEFDGF